MFARIKAAIGRALAHYLQKQRPDYVNFGATPPDRLRLALRSGDVLLVEGDRRISVAIKYLTHSTWSHAAFYTGDPGAELIEADAEKGVHTSPLSDYSALNTRICRPANLSADHHAQVMAFMRASVGKTYDLQNVFDLIRFLLPQPPVPRRWRRRMLALGSGDPTRAICSTLLAQAFEQVRYPILPDVQYDLDGAARREILHIRHHSLFTPRDFDLSPYFSIVKPTLESGFDYKVLRWDADAGPQDSAGHLPDPAVSPPPRVR